MDRPRAYPTRHSKHLVILLSVTNEEDSAKLVGLQSEMVFARWKERAVPLNIKRKDEGANGSPWAQLLQVSTSSVPAMRIELIILFIGHPFCGMFRLDQARQRVNAFL